MDQKKTVISAPHTSYLILSMPVPLRSCYSTFNLYLFKQIFLNHTVLFVCKKILHKNCLVVFLSCIPACLTPVSVFTYSRFCVHLFFMGRPRTPPPSFQVFSQTILDYTHTLLFFVFYFHYLRPCLWSLFCTWAVLSLTATEPFHIWIPKKHTNFKHKLT